MSQSPHDPSAAVQARLTVLQEENLQLKAEVLALRGSVAELKAGLEHLQTAQPNRRDTERKRPPANTRLLASDASGRLDQTPIEVVDYSAKGLCLQLDELVPINATLYLRPEGAPPEYRLIEGRVCWRVAWLGRWRIGCELERAMSADDRKFLGEMAG